MHVKFGVSYHHSLELGQGWQFSQECCKPSKNMHGLSFPFVLEDTLWPFILFMELTKCVQKTLGFASPRYSGTVHMTDVSGEELDEAYCSWWPAQFPYANKKKWSLPEWLQHALFGVTLTHIGHKTSSVLWATICPLLFLRLKLCTSPSWLSPVFTFRAHISVQNWGTQSILKEFSFQADTIA